MKNVALDGSTVLQLDANGTDGALDAAAHCEVLRNDVGLFTGMVPSLTIKDWNRSGADGGKRFADLALLLEIYFVYSAGEAKADRRNRLGAAINISPCRY